MLLKRAKIRAEIKAPEAAKEDQPFQVAVVLINEGKMAARRGREHATEEGEDTGRDQGPRGGEGRAKSSASKTPSASCKADCAPATTAPHSIIMAVVLI